MLLTNHIKQWCQGRMRNSVFPSDTTATNHCGRTYFLVSSHSRPSPLVRAPPQLTLFPSPNTCAVDDFQRLRFGNSQSPEKFTGNPKIFSHPISSQESLKHKSTFTFTLRTIYPSTRSMAQPDIKDIYQRRVLTCHQ